jgi:hypothetical protein
MSWSRLTPLANDRAHCHAVHEALADRCFTPRYQKLVEESCAAYDRVQALMATGLSERAARAADEAEHGFGDFIENQCGGCRFYIPLEGGLGSDWGLCTALGTEFFGTPKFEHDGCTAFEADAHADETK